MTISHLHCRVKNLLVSVEWFMSRCEVVPSFSDTRMAVLQFGAFTLILDAASDDTVATIGFNSVDCNGDFAALVERGARVVEPPQDRPYGARVAYLQGARRDHNRDRAAAPIPRMTVASQSQGLEAFDDRSLTVVRT